MCGVKPFILLWPTDHLSSIQHGGVCVVWCVWGKYLGQSRDEEKKRSLKSVRVRVLDRGST